MPVDHETVVRRWFEEVWNQGREETVDELFAPDAIAHGLAEGGAEARGPEDFKIFSRGLRSAFPDIHIGIEDLIVHGDKVAARFVVEGTHGGDGIGVAPTQRRVSVEGMCIVRIGDGQIVEAWNYWDQLGLLRQLGTMPAAPGDSQTFSVTA